MIGGKESIIMMLIYYDGLVRYLLGNIYNVLVLFNDFKNILDIICENYWVFYIFIMFFM